MANNFGRNLLLIGLAVLGNSGRAAAQSRDYFHRVTTAAERDTRPSFNRDGRRSPEGNVRATESLSRLALARGDTRRLVSMSDSGVLHPYTTRAELELQDRESNGGRDSTWRQQSEPLTPTPRVTSLSRSHTYYPGMRGGVSYSQPLTLTTRQTMLPGNFCFGGPSPAMAGGGSQAGAAMLHHR